MIYQPSAIWLPQIARAVLLSIPLLTVSAVAPVRAAQFQATAPAPVPGQTGGQDQNGGNKLDPELEKKVYAWLEELIAEAAALTSIESRIYVQAKAVELFWKHDETRARTLVREVMSQIAAAGAGFSPEGGRFQEREMFKFGIILNQRRQLMNFLAMTDIDLALEFLRATRFPRSKSLAGMGGGDEEFLESQLIVQLATRDPQKALRLAEDIMKGDPTYQTIEIWNSVRQKDPELGAKLATEIVAKLRSADLMNDSAKIDIAVSMLQSFKQQMFESSEQRAGESPGGRPGAAASKPPAGPPAGQPAGFKESQQAYRDLLGTIAGAALKLTASSFVGLQEADKSRSLLTQVKELLPDLEQFSPSQATALRAKLTQFDQALYYSPQQRQYDEFQQKIQDKSSTELVAMAESAPPEMRELVFQTAIGKALEQGDRESARKIAKEHLSDAPENKYLLAKLDREDADRAFNEGRLEEARKLLPQAASVEEEIYSLSNWAHMALAKKDEKTARQCLDEARRLSGDRTQTRAQLEAQMLIASGYLSLDPGRSFEIAATVIDRLDQVIAASIEVAVFNGIGDGDNVIGTAGVESLTSTGFRQLAPRLALRDFDRTVALFNRWKVQNVKLVTGMIVLQQLLGEAGRLQALEPGGFATPYGVISAPTRYPRHD